MPIKFACPSCKKSISAKEHLAGKKVKCPSCKEALTVPAPVPAPADVDELAMSVLGEKPAEQPTEPAAKPIEFECPMCGDPVSVAAELAGKQTPCPHCGRIVKVPVPVKRDPTDWRTANQVGPSAARQNLETAAPEGAWGTAVSRGQVSRESLEDAGAIPEAQERLTLAQKVRRGVTIATPVLAVFVLAWYVWGVLARSKEAKAVDQALAAAKQLHDNKKTEAAGELHRAAGEFYLHTNKRGCWQQAQAQFRESRARFDEGNGSERDALLIDLALTQAELGGSPAEADNEVRMHWTRTGGSKLGNAQGGADQEVQQTLTQLRSPDARLTAIREVGRKLVAKGQAPLAATLAATLAPNEEQRAEAAALAGLEMYRTDPAAAEAEANQALAMLPPKTPGGKAPAVSPAVIALCLALNKSELLDRLPADARAGAQADNPAVLLGWIEGLALQDKGADARPLLAKLPTPQDRLQGYLALAAGLEAKQTEAARKALEAASQEVQQRGRGLPPWAVLRLIRLGRRTGLAEQQLLPLPAAIQDSGLRAWAQLEVLRARLAASKGKAGDDWLDGVDKGTTAAYVAREEVARHNAHVDGGGTLTAVQQWPEEYRPFGVIGAVVGAQDGK
jgi:transcription elongation factor Elf1